MTPLFLEGMEVGRRLTSGLRRHLSSSYLSSWAKQPPKHNRWQNLAAEVGIVTKCSWEAEMKSVRKFLRSWSSWKRGFIFHGGHRRSWPRSLHSEGRSKMRYNRGPQGRPTSASMDQRPVVRGHLLTSHVLCQTTPGSKRRGKTVPSKRLNSIWWNLPSPLVHSVSPPTSVSLYFSMGTYFFLEIGTIYSGLVFLNLFIQFSLSDRYEHFT